MKTSAKCFKVQSKTGSFIASSSSCEMHASHDTLEEIASLKMNERLGARESGRRDECTFA